MVVYVEDGGLPLLDKRAAGNQLPFDEETQNAAYPQVVCIMSTLSTTQ